MEVGEGMEGGGRMKGKESVTEEGKINMTNQREIQEEREMQDEERERGNGGGEREREKEQEKKMGEEREKEREKERRERERERERRELRKKLVALGVDSGDIILFNRKCSTMSLYGAMVCAGAKVLANSDYDHLGVVIRHANGQLFVLEANVGKRS